MAAPFTVLIMAAGQGTRMLSDTPKVLHRVAGKSLVEWVADAARAAGAERVVAVVRPGDGVAEGLPDGIEVAEQREGEGTGAAVLAARDAVPRRSRSRSVVLSGDHPLITAEQLEGLLAEHEQQGAGRPCSPRTSSTPPATAASCATGSGHVDRIVETKYTDGLSPEELAVDEINLGTYVFDAKTLFDALDSVETREGRALPDRGVPDPPRAGRQPSPRT